MLNFSHATTVCNDSACLNRTAPPPALEPGWHWEAMGLVVAIFGTAFGNLLVCLAVFLERNLRHKNNFYLTSLAIADLLVAVLVMPFGLLVELYGRFRTFNVVYLIVYLLAWSSSVCLIAFVLTFNAEA